MRDKAYSRNQPFKSRNTMRNYQLCLLIILTSFDIGSFTDVEVSSQLVEDSLGINIYIPVLLCNVKYSGYHHVYWYKDGLNVKTSSNDSFGHLFLPTSLLNNSYFPMFKNPLQLQGYYWCETDTPPEDDAEHKFLFQIESVNTFAGSFLATQDSLGNNKSISNDVKIAVKKEIYTFEMEETLFGFLPKPNTFITDIKSTENGLEIHFLLYTVPAYGARLQGDPRLIEDEHILHDVVDYLHNQTDTDPEFYENFLQWTDFRGIDIYNISITSTIGCYAERTFNPSKRIAEVSWPYTFVDDIAIAEESCTTKDGLPVTRECKGSFNEGASWSSVVGICEEEPNARTKSLKDLSKSLHQMKSPVNLQTLEGLLASEPALSATDLIIAANILGRLAFSNNIEAMDRYSIFTSIDLLLKTDSDPLRLAKEKLQFTKRILLTIDNVIEKANLEHMVLEISKSTYLAFTKETAIGDRHVNGAFVSIQASNSTIEHDSVEFLINGSGFPYYEGKAGFLLPTELIVKRESELEFPCQLNMVYFKDWRLFNDPQLSSEISHLKIQLPIMMISLSGGPIWNLSYPIKLFFKHELQKFYDTAICVYFDPKRRNEGAWAREGCSYEGLQNGFHVCHCHHLSIFSIILTEKKAYSSPIFNSHLSLYVGCSFSVAFLTIVVLLYILSKTWRQTIDQDVLFQISLSFLCSVILLLVHEVHPKWEPGCLLLSHAFFCNVFAMFCWLFVQSIVYYIRFSKKAETSDISHFLTKCTFFAWGFPIIIIAIIGISRRYAYYDQITCWQTLEEVSGVAIVPIIIIMVLAMYFFLNATYSISCRYKKDFIVGTPKYKDDVLKCRAAITLFIVLILSWLFGYLAVWHKRKEMQVLFGIFIILSSLYISLFFIFHEMSLGELLYRKKNDISEPLSENKSHDNQAYKSIEQ